jgi:hypothetical protein
MTAKIRPPVRVDRLRMFIMFVIAWLVGLSVFEVVRQMLHGAWGVALAGITIAVNMYARRRAMHDVERSRTRWIWEKLPIVLFVVVPLLVRLIGLIWRPGDRTWWGYFGPLVPLVIKLGVPVAVLYYVYLMLNRYRVFETAATAAAVPAPEAPPAVVVTAPAAPQAPAVEPEATI